MLNWSLIRHPVNWVTILLMTIIAAFAVDIFSRALKTASDN